RVRPLTPFGIGRLVVPPGVLAVGLQLVGVVLGPVAEERVPSTTAERHRVAQRASGGGTGRGRGREVICEEAAVVVALDPVAAVVAVRRRDEPADAVAFGARL